MRYLPLLLLLSSCMGSTDVAIVQGPSARKQKQKIANLQKKLDSAESEKKKAEEEVDTLVSEINRAKLLLIQKQISDYEKKGKKTDSLFTEERELLYRMIEMGPSPSAFEAQVELDRILRIITESNG
jgi:peptidoglycan hydrolase CwlO-like protein